MLLLFHALGAPCSVFKARNSFLFFTSKEFFFALSFLVHRKADEDEAFQDCPVHAFLFAELPEPGFNRVVAAEKRMQI